MTEDNLIASEEELNKTVADLFGVLSALLGSINLILYPWVAVSTRMAALAMKVLSKESLAEIEKIISKGMKEEEDSEAKLKGFAEMVQKLVRIGNVQRIDRLCNTVIHGKQD